MTKEVKIDKILHNKETWIKVSVNIVENMCSFQ